MYHSLPEEDFACLPLRIFLSTLLANVVCKPLIHMLADPDFINMQVARLVRLLNNGRALSGECMLISHVLYKLSSA